MKRYHERNTGVPFRFSIIALFQVTFITSLVVAAFVYPEPQVIGIIDLCLVGGFAARNSKLGRLLGTQSRTIVEWVVVTVSVLMLNYAILMPHGR